MATAAKCGALELCQITAWDPALRVTAAGAGRCGVTEGDDGGMRPSCPKTWGWGNPSLATRCWAPSGASADALKQQRVSQQGCLTGGAHVGLGVCRVSGKNEWVPRDVPKCPLVGCFGFFFCGGVGFGGESRVGWGSRCRGSILMCPLSQQKGIPCHLCQVVVSVVGKILQDNRTEVGHGWGERRAGLSPHYPTGPARL